jgi:hypothetical protein
MTKYSDLQVHQGEDISFRLEIVDENGAVKDLTGLNARARFRKSYSSSNATTYSFSTSFGANDPTLGLLDLTLAGEVSDDIPRGRYVYDVFLLTNGSLDISEKILEGQIEVMPSVTSII